MRFPQLVLQGSQGKERAHLETEDQSALVSLIIPTMTTLGKTSKENHQLDPVHKQNEGRESVLTTLSHTYTFHASGKTVVLNHGTICIVWSCRVKSIFSPD